MGNGNSFYDSHKSSYDHIFTAPYQCTWDKNPEAKTTMPKRCFDKTWCAQTKYDKT